MTEESIVAAALEKATAVERTTYLDATCAGDSDLRRRVEARLEAHGAPGDRVGVEDLSVAATPREFPSSPAGQGSPTRPSLGGEADRIGPYRIIREIGRGGMGAVYLAEQEVPIRRQVALKVIKPGMDSELVIARFEAERQALALMQHPNIARILDTGTTDAGRPYFVMELVAGIPITEYCDEARLDPRERLELFIPVCQAVQHAHQKGIIHRDIKPSNVLVTVVDDRPVPRVIDFGVAKALDQRLTERTLYTQQGAIVGTPEYMSPEQAGVGDVDVDTRSDIYSLGVLLYELLTGTTPLGRAKVRELGLGEVLRRIQEEEPPRPSTRLSGPETDLSAIAASRGVEPARLTRLVRGELDWIVMKALEKDRSRRYETAGGLARDLRRHLDGDPVEAGPPSAAYRLRKLARRHRAALATVGAFALVLVVASGVSTYLAIRARQAERAALKAEGQALASLTKAREEEAKARRAASEARAVLGFFQDKVLAAGRPEGQEGGLGKDTTIRAAIDAAEPGIAGGFAAQPTVEASIRRTIGQGYRFLGNTPGAVRQLERARMLQVAALGPDHTETLETSSNLADAYREAGRAEDAIPLHEQTLAFRRTRLGPDHPETLVSMNNLADAYRQAGRLDDAIRMFRESLALLRVKLGSDHPDTLICIDNLGGALWESGRLAEAVPLYQEAFRGFEARLGPDHPDTLVCMDSLGSASRDLGRFDDAISLLQRALSRRRAKLDADHPATLVTMNNLGGAYRAAGRVADAIAILEPALAMQGRKIGRDHPHTLVTASNLASAYQDAGRLDEALSLHRQTLEFRRAKLGADHPHTLLSLNNLAGACLEAKRWAEAEELLRACLGARQKRDPDDWWRFHTMSQLGWALVGQEKHAEAEPLLIGGYEGLKDREARIPAPARRNLAAAAGRIVPFYEAWGRADRAVKWRARLEGSSAESKSTP
jgi:serine/threonine protein kinase/tetratricopeptide (TPR) repeat protein